MVLPLMPAIAHGAAAALTEQMHVARSSKAAHDALQREFADYKARAAKILQVC